MVRFLGIRFLRLIPTLLLVTMAVSFLVELVPGDPAREVVGADAPQGTYEKVRKELHLDEPVMTRYVDWLGGAVKGDLGDTVLPPYQHVGDILKRAWPVSFQLAIMAFTFALLLAVPLAIWSAYRPGGRLDRIVSASVFTVMSIPTFLGATLLLMVFAIRWPILPVGQWARPSELGWAENFKYAALPVLTLGLTASDYLIRLLRGDMMTTLQEDFILAARAKGMPPRHILFKEALRPSSFSLLTTSGLLLASLLGGTVIIERIFALPGLGTVVVQSTYNKDFTTLKGAVLVIGMGFILMNLIVDLLYGYLDPRIRRGNH